MRRLRIGVDTGGTFTDFVVLDEDRGTLDVFKVPSTRPDQADAIIGGLADYLSRSGDPAESVAFFCHGTTVGTNAILEANGARTGLVVTEGFRGIYEVGEQTRGHGSIIYDLFFEKPRALVPARLTEEVLERVGSRGEVQLPLDEKSARMAIEQLVRHKVDSVAVCLLFSFKHPEHEQQLKRLFGEIAPEINVSISSEVSPEIREYYRMSTTVVNAYLNPLLGRYVHSLDGRLHELGVPTDQRYIIRSNGGVASFETARDRSVQTILSGPAAGVVTAQHVASSAGIPNLVTFDMGGTSTDVALIKEGEPVRRMGGKVHGLDVLVPMLDIHTVAAGGGTIAWVDEMEALQVGPRSAGSDPGPACYGKGGTEPTVTDANVALGVLSADQPLAGGALKLDRDAAERAIYERIAKPLGLSVTEAARGIVEIVNVKMQEAIKVVSSNRGYDLRDFYLFAFGGAGPLHACQIAEEMGMKGVVIPPYPGVTSALGLLLSDVRHDYVHSDLRDLNDVQPGQAESIFLGLRDRGMAQLRSEGFSPDLCRFVWDMDLRYIGQGYELTVALPDIPHLLDDLRQLRQRFDEAHLQLTGHFAPNERVEVVNYRVSAIAKVPRAPLAVPLPDHGSLDLAHAGDTAVFFHDRFETTPMYQRSFLAAGMEVTGPAVILQNDSTTVLGPGQAGTMDAWGYLRVESRL
ncbi:MAG: hydantoinase/oxoprolinase family protein [Actinomycetota bacterium]|nr:MAG: hydantoinase/oxoprolinase family protein [Actinomycetota bacterium]